MKQFVVRLETVVGAESEEVALTQVLLKLAPSLFVTTDVEEFYENSSSPQHI